jgi:hypothetical protein
MVKMANRNWIVLALRILKDAFLSHILPTRILEKIVLLEADTDVPNQLSLDSQSDNCSSSSSPRRWFDYLFPINSTPSETLETKITSASHHKKCSDVRDKTARS